MMQYSAGLIPATNRRSKKMQVWNQVKVKTGAQHEGEAGVVVAVNAAEDRVTVKLDSGTVAGFSAAELEYLGG